MKYTIHGFSQEKAIELGLDHDDLIILRYIIDFRDSGEMATEVVENECYYWVNYEGILKQFPILKLKKDSVYRRLKAMCKSEILKHKTIKHGGTFSFYTIGLRYKELISSDLNPKGTDLNPGGYGFKSRKGTDLNPERKIHPLKDSSIKDNSKKERKNSSYDEVINNYTSNAALKDALVEFIKMRNLIKCQLTDRALQLLLGNLDKLADNDTTKIAILEQSIMNNWKSVYAIKGDARNGSTGQNNASGKGKWDGYEPEKPKAGADDTDDAGLI